MRLNITGRTGVGVMPPGAAYSVCFLEDLEVVDAAFPELDAGTDTCKAGADNEHLKLCYLGLVLRCDHFHTKLNHLL